MQRLAALLFVFSFYGASAQNLFFPQRNFQNPEFERYIVSSDSIIHTALQPQTSFLSDVDRQQHLKLIGQKQRRTYFGRKLLGENFIQVEKEGLFLTIDPMYNLQFGQDEFTSENLFQNTRGIMVNGEINKKLQFFTTFFENQGIFPNYLSRFVRSIGVFPGNGRVKNFGTTGYDFAMASGMISFNAFDWLNIQFGNHKNFIGNGYRSLLLSDNTFNYPHLKFIAKSKNSKWVYQSIYTSLINLQRLPATTSSEAQFQRKAATFHYLSFKPNSKFSIGLFEGVIWQRRNAEGSIPFNWNFINPVWGFNSAFTGFDRHQTNNTLGLDASYKPFKGGQVYGQFILGNTSNNKNGFQAGLRYFDVFKIENLRFRLEYNSINSFNTYQGNGNNFNYSLNYSHYNQPLGMPSSDILKEFVSTLDYEFKGIYINGFYSHGKGINDVYQRDLASIEAGYLFNKLTGLRLGVFYLDRNANNNYDLYGDSNWAGIKFSSNINNYYLDF